MIICSCSGSIENKAKEQLEKTVKEFAKDPSSISINNLEVIFSDDSICIFNFKLSGRNGFGLISTKNCEYVYLTKKKKNDKKPEEAYELLRDLDKKKSIMSIAKDLYKKIHRKEGSVASDMSEDEIKANYIHCTAYAHVLMYGREVVDGEKSDEKNISNW